MFRFNRGKQKYPYSKYSFTKNLYFYPTLNTSTSVSNKNIKKVTKAIDARMLKDPLEYLRMNNNRESAEDSFGLNPYAMDKQFKKIFMQHPSAHVDVEVIGRTASYIDITLYKITERAKEVNLRAKGNKYSEDAPEKKIIFIVHALSSMGLGKLCALSDEKYLKKLISFYIAHLDKFDILLMPMANPDGYLQSKRLQYWNKNVSPQAASTCAGVALDRNFDVAWNTTHLINSCSQRYPGPFPFSEAESMAVRDVFHRYSHKLIAYFHAHSGTYDPDIYKGDAVLYPRGYSDTQSDEDKYLDLKVEIDEAIRNANFKVLSVTVDTLYNWYGKVSGSSVDYADLIYGIPYAMELVMQIYQDPTTFNKLNIRNLHEELDYQALTEIWGRVIEVIFTNLWKKSKTQDSDNVF